MSQGLDDAFLRGEHCRLRPLRPEDAEGPWSTWFNDPEVTRYMLRGTFPTTPALQAEFRESVEGSETDLVLAIVADGDRHVGTAGLHRIDWVNGNAEFGIVIGERSVWGKGVGTEATRLLCGHGFSYLNLHRIWLGCLVDHAAAIALYERVGFRVEGRLRGVRRRNGVWDDQLIMGLLEGELR